MTIDNELALEFLRKAEHDLGSARSVLRRFMISMCYYHFLMIQISIPSGVTP